MSLCIGRSALREGEDAFAQLGQLAIDEQLQGATVSGLGFGHATFGYFVKWGAARSSYKSSRAVQRSCVSVTKRWAPRC